MTDEAVVLLRPGRAGGSADVVRRMIVNHHDRVADGIVVTVQQCGHRHPRHAQLHGEREDVNETVVTQVPRHGWCQRRASATAMSIAAHRIKSTASRAVIGFSTTLSRIPS